MSNYWTQRVIALLLPLTRASFWSGDANDVFNATQHAEALIADLIAPYTTPGGTMLSSVGSYTPSSTYETFSSTFVNVDTVNIRQVFDTTAVGTVTAIFSARASGRTAGCEFAVSLNGVIGGVVRLNDNVENEIVVMGSWDNVPVATRNVALQYRALGSASARIIQDMPVSWVVFYQ